MRLRIKPWFDNTDKGMYKKAPSFAEQELAVFLCALWGIFLVLVDDFSIKKINKSCGYPVYNFLYVNYMIFFHYMSKT